MENDEIICWLWINMQARLIKFAGVFIPLPGSKSVFVLRLCPGLNSP
jgi:hypothetical protein